MQNALLGVRQSHQGRSIILKHKWLKSVPYCDVVTSSRLASRRHISFPGFIPQAPSERRARTVADELTSRGRLREANDEDFSFSEGLKQGITQVLSKQHNLPQADLPQPGSALYGKWQSLSLDEKRMLHEFDVNVSDSTLVREVDQAGNEHDIELWSCLLEFAHRRMGRDGVIMIWQSVSRRRSLYQVDGALAQNFWAMILNTAVSDDNLLRDVVRYAEWLDQTHDVQWPRLYPTVITFMLQRLSEGNVQQAKEWKRLMIRWHFAMAPSSLPSEDEFGKLMKEYIIRPGFVLQDTLKLLYIYSPYRKLYDTLILYLYNEGRSELAIKWRALLVTFHDLPMSVACRPFLRFVAGYYSRISLTMDELKVAGLVLTKIEGKEPNSIPPETAITGRNLSYLINRVHGETFGINEKPYNDKLGAKWFASSWVSVDFAINVIYTMGVQTIGPLSLQSIGLREGSARGVVHRIDQLRQLNIGLPKSNYVLAVQHYAAAGDDEALQELLQSDMHPDIFDDEEAQYKLLADCLRVGDWNTYRLVLSTRLALDSSLRATATDGLLEYYIGRGNGPMALKVMEEMSAHRLELAPTTSHMLSSLILQGLSAHADVTATRSTQRHIDLCISLCRRLAATRFPPAVEVWQTLLYRLGREKRLSDLERLCLYIVRLYTDHTTSDQPMWMSHTADVPPILRLESPFPNFQRIPGDLSMRHEHHHLRQIFDAKLQNSIVRWGFTYTTFDRAAEGTAATLLRNYEHESDGAKTLWPPSAFHFARGIRLLAMLRDEGIFINTPTVTKQAELRLKDLYRGEGRATYEWVGGNPRLSSLRRQVRFSLSEAKRLCDIAWGKGEVVSSLLDLDRQIGRIEQMDSVKEVKMRTAALENRNLVRRKGW